MANDEFDLRDIMLEATAEVQEIIREILQELAEPSEGNQVAQLWSRTPDDMKEQFASSQPEDYRNLIASLGERKG